MKKAIKSLTAVLVATDKRFEEACINLEKKVCGGKTIDEKLNNIDNKVISFIKDIFAHDKLNK